MSFTSLKLLSLAVLGLAGWAVSRAHHRRQEAALSLSKTQALQTWEGEGGGLPDGGPQVRLIEPAPAPADDTPT